VEKSGTPEPKIGKERVKGVEKAVNNSGGRSEMGLQAGIEGGEGTLSFMPKRKKRGERVVHGLSRRTGAADRVRLWMHLVFRCPKKGSERAKTRNFKSNRYKEELSARWKKSKKAEEEKN